MYLNHRGHICICKLSINGSDNVLLSGRRQAIIWKKQCCNFVNTTLNISLKVRINNIPALDQIMAWLCVNQPQWVNWNLRNNFQWNPKRNSCIFHQENAFENVVCKMAVISYRPRCVKATDNVQLWSSKNNSWSSNDHLWKSIIHGAPYLHLLYS